MKSEISGRITRILVEEGDSVQRGEVLVELDRISLQTRVREAERSFEADRLRLERSKRNYERLKELHTKKFVGEKEFLDAKTDFKLSELNLEIAQARLEDAEEDLSKTVITAPHEGILTLINVTDGQVISGATSVSNGTDLLTIAQLSELAELGYREKIRAVGNRSRPGDDLPICHIDQCKDTLVRRCYNSFREILFGIFETGLCDLKIEFGKFKIGLGI